MTSRHLLPPIRYQSSLIINHLPEQTTARLPGRRWPFVQSSSIFRSRVAPPYLPRIFRVVHSGALSSTQGAALPGVARDMETSENEALSSSHHINFVVRTCEGPGTARTGLFQLPSRAEAVQTPAMLLYSRRGLPVHLTPDVLEGLRPEAAALQICTLDFLDTPPYWAVGKFGRGLHTFLGLEGFGLLAIGRDPLLFTGAGPSNNKLGASFETHGGRRQLGPSKYMEIVNAIQPDAFSVLADETPFSASVKRTVLAVDRTLQWLDTCLSEAKAPIRGTALGVIVGGASDLERRRSARETAARQVAGFVLAGFGLGESANERTPLLQAVIENLPEDKVRHISGLSMPEDVLQGVAQGIDLFDSTYPHLLTTGGFALVHPLCPAPNEWGELESEKSADASQNSHPRDSGAVSADCLLSGANSTGGAAGGEQSISPLVAAVSTKPGAQAGEDLADHAVLGCDWTKINLRSLAYRDSKAPLLDGCDCYACQNHTRAYVHHLLNTHEMLAEVLLDIHNTHRHLGFFREIRRAIDERRFQEYRDWFLSRRRQDIGPKL